MMDTDVLNYNVNAEAVAIAVCAFSHSLHELRDKTVEVKDSSPTYEKACESLDVLISQVPLISWNGAQIAEMEETEDGVTALEDFISDLEEARTTIEDLWIKLDIGEELSEEDLKYLDTLADDLTPVDKEE